MNNALGMKRLQRLRHLHRDVQQFFELQRFPVDSLLQAFPFQLLHHNEGMSAVVLYVMNGANVRMVQARRGPRLPLKAVKRFAIAKQIVRNELQRNVTAQAHVFRFVNNAHTTAANLPQNAIVGDSLADDRRRCHSR